ncbi:hypothetical protein B0H11DRAFT_2228388 [Mycena galericulata]|nr:hypothetical protein B0H11DRAFT_2228388 [Mycena galericulata]
MFSVAVRRAPAALRAWLPLRVSNPVSVLGSIRSLATQDRTQGLRAQRHYRRICPNCRLEGHEKKDCKAPTICVACGVEGHERKHCPNPDPARIEALNTAPKKWCAPPHVSAFAVALTSYCPLPSRPNSFRCGVAGHTIKECQEPPKCFSCGLAVRPSSLSTVLPLLLLLISPSFSRPLTPPHLPSFPAC